MDSRLVVGVDGSEESLAAVRWALLFGSLSQQCAHHAPCPSVIVPHTS